MFVDSYLACGAYGTLNNFHTHPHSRPVRCFRCSASWCPWDTACSRLRACPGCTSREDSPDTTSSHPPEEMRTDRESRPLQRKYHKCHAFNIPGNTCDVSRSPYRNTHPEMSLLFLELRILSDTSRTARCSAGPGRSRSGTVHTSCCWSAAGPRRTMLI